MLKNNNPSQRAEQQKTAAWRVKATVIATSFCALLATSALHAANADAVVAVTDEDPSTGACTITVEPTENAKCDSGGQDICVASDTKLEFTSRPEGKEFVIVPDPWKNPLFVTGLGSGQCKARSKNGRLKCKVNNPANPNPPEVGYKFWVFADGCKDPLDPVIYVNR